MISLGAICGITTVILVLLLGQARVLFAMSRDHLLPPALARVHPRFGTPWLITIGTGVVVALMAGFVPLAKLSELTSIGTLFAFVVVALGVIVLRRTRPDLPRAFRTPWVPFVPILAVVACLWLMINLPVDTWIRFAHLDGDRLRPLLRVRHARRRPPPSGRGRGVDPGLPRRPTPARSRLRFCPFSAGIRAAWDSTRATR